MKRRSRRSGAVASVVAGGHDEINTFYRNALLRLNAAAVPYMVGGAYALEALTGIRHRTKDLDLFVRHGDCDGVLSVLREFGCVTRMAYPHWLAKAYWRDRYIDVIFSTGNGQARVDDQWLEHAVPATILGVPVYLCPVEETIWTKAFIMERERYDGADVAHLLRAWADRLDWCRLLDCFGDDWPVLLSHLTLFGFIYPGERARIPVRVMRELMTRALDQWDAAPAEPRLCRGGLLSRAQYRVEVEKWGYLDARLMPFGRMTGEEAQAWSNAAAAADPTHEPARISSP